MIALLLRAGKANVLACTIAVLVLATALDWATGDNVSLAAALQQYQDQLKDAGHKQ